MNGTKGPRPKVGLVVLNWNGWEDTRECLASLGEITYYRARVYVVDNGSVDGSPEKIAIKFPEVTLLTLGENRGFGGGMNAGLRAALADGCDFFLCMNNDMVAEPGFLEPLVAAALQGKLVPYPALYIRNHPEVIDTLGNRVNLMTGITSMIEAGSNEVPARLDPDYTEIPLLAREVLETVGTWREEYFVFYEDVDLGMRIQRAGWELRCVPEARILHRRGSTASRVYGIKSYYSMRNRLMFVRAFGSWWHYASTVLHIFVLTLPYILAKRLLSSSYKHSVKHVLLGIADGLLPWRRGLKRPWQVGPAPAATTRP